MGRNRTRGAAGAFFALAALAAALLIDVLMPVSPVLLRDTWAVHASLVEERPPIADRLALRGRSAVAALRAQARDTLHNAAVVVARFMLSFMGAFA